MRPSALLHRARVIAAALTLIGAVLPGAVCPEAAPLHPLAKERKVAGFHAMDRNGDGRLSLAEFLAVRGDSPQARREFAWHDLNGDGSVTLDEYLADPPRKPVPGKPYLRY